MSANFFYGFNSFLPPPSPLKPVAQLWRRFVFFMLSVNSCKCFSNDFVWLELFRRRSFCFLSLFLRWQEYTNNLRCTWINSTLALLSYAKMDYLSVSPIYFCTFFQKMKSEMAKTIIIIITSPMNTRFKTENQQQQQQLAAATVTTTAHVVSQNVEHHWSKHQLNLHELIQSKRMSALSLFVCLFVFFAWWTNS